MFTGLCFQTEKVLVSLVFISRCDKNLLQTVSGILKWKKNPNSVSYFKMWENLVVVVAGISTVILNCHRCCSKLIYIRQSCAVVVLLKDSKSIMEAPEQCVKSVKIQHFEQVNFGWVKTIWIFHYYILPERWRSSFT